MPGQDRGPSVRGSGLSRVWATDRCIDGTAAVERVFREEYGRLIASLVRRFGDLDIAEEAAGEALLAALEKMAKVRRPCQPGRLARRHRETPRDRPDPPREAA